MCLEENATFACPRYAKLNLTEKCKPTAIMILNDLLLALYNFSLFFETSDLTASHQLCHVAQYLALGFGAVLTAVSWSWWVRKKKAWGNTKICNKYSSCQRIHLPGKDSAGPIWTELVHNPNTTNMLPEQPSSKSSTEMMASNTVIWACQQSERSYLQSVQ